MADTAPAHAPDGPEPDFTIYRTEGWASARARLEQGDEVAQDCATLLRKVMDHVETGWYIVRELVLVAEQRPYESGDYGYLLRFIEAELGDAFRSVAGSLAHVVAGWPGWGRATTDDVSDFWKPSGGTSRCSGLP
jgi:hypothetical protein